MHDDINDINDINDSDDGQRRPLRRPARRARRRGRLLGVVVGAGLLLAACGGGSGGGAGVAKLGSSAASGQSSPSTTVKPDPVAFSRCMRDHGVANFPDPDSSGHIKITGKPGDGMDPKSGTMQAAQEACKSLAPAPSDAQKQQDNAKSLKFAKCMRDHGLSTFPDPVQGQGMMINLGKDLDPNSSAFKTAQEACKQYMPGDGQTATSGG
jgi:hypothetical protein